jgi:hypothetical protein
MIAKTCKLNRELSNFGKKWIFHFISANKRGLFCEATIHKLQQCNTALLNLLKNRTCGWQNPRDEGFS